MEIKLKRATPADLAAMLTLVADARAFLKAQGLDQWQNGYPDEAVLRADIAEGRGWLLWAGGAPVAMAALCHGEEPDYRVIHGGAWGANGAYAAIHRVAAGSAARGGGAAAQLFRELEGQCRAAGLASVRVDTHPGNLPMRRFLEKQGYTPRGTIYLGPGSGGEAGDARLAFDKLL